MENPVRTTIYLKPEVRKALRLYAAENDQSLSDVVNDVLVAEFVQDLEDMAAMRKRAGGGTETYEDFIAGFKKV